MNRYVRALLCSIFSVAIIFGCFSFPVSADTLKTIELNQYLQSESECNPYKEYKLIIPKSTYYDFRLTTTGVEYDTGNIDPSTIKTMEEMTPILHLFNSNGTEYSNGHYPYWMKGVAIAEYHLYLEQGEYSFYISSFEVCNLSIEGFDGEIYLTKNGQRIDYVPMTFNAYSYNCNYIFNDGGDNEYNIVLKPGKSGRIYKIYTDNSLDSLRDLDKTVTIPVLKDGSSNYVFIVFRDDWYKLDLEFIYVDNAIPDPIKYGHDRYRNMLTEPGKIEKISFSIPKGNIEIKDGITNDVVVKDSEMNATIDYPNVYFTYLRSPAFIYCFIKDKSSKNVIELDKTYDASPALFSSKSINSQLVYSFTPSKDSVYNLSSTGLGANPYVAVFDSNDNCIGFYDSDKNITDYNSIAYWQQIYTASVDFNLNLDIELKANQTYYFYFTNSYYYQIKNTRIDYSSSNPFSFKLTDKSAKPESSVSSEERSFADFVERLYVVALERDSEPEGKAFWCEKVQDGTYDGAYCARFFLTSPEFLGKNKTDEQFVDTLYRTFFDREADDEGRAFWIKKIKESSKETVIEGFINSTEWCNICASYGVKSGAQWAKATIASKNATAFATRLYTECLGRDAETEGLNYWSLSLTNLERTGTQAAKEFFYSEEFLSKNLSNEEYVMRLYGTFMGRTPEAEGKAYWIDLLNNGGSRDEVFNFFASCPEFTEICTKYAIDR